MSKLVLQLFLIVLCYGQAYNQTEISCAHINGGSFSNNLDSLWSVVSLPIVDRYVFLSVCPIILIAELVTLKFYHSYPKILGRAGILLMVIVVYEMMTILHFITAGIYSQINHKNVEMVGNFPTYCEINAIIASFFSTLHFIYIMIVPLYVVYVLRWTLKAGDKIWKFIYLLGFVASALITYFLWEEGYLGLNIYGWCGMSFLRMPNVSLVYPISIIGFNVIFIGSGLFTIKYVKKHMPNSLGLRQSKKHQKHTLIIYVLGYASFWTLEDVISILLYFNCRSDDPSGSYFPLVTVFNLAKVLQCTFIFVIIYKNVKVRRCFVKFLRRLCSRKRNNGSFSVDHNSSDTSRQQDFNFEQVLLKIKQENNEIDMLKISQVVTLVSGIYVAYKHYYNQRDYFKNLGMIQVSTQQLGKKGQPQNAYFLATKKIYFNEKLTIKINSQVISDFITDLSLFPKLGILACTMIIHAPKIFQLLLEIDDLKEVFSSFELHDNTRKMFDLAEGQGGKSGQFFFFSKDYKYVLKTITIEEFTFIDQNLFYFYQHFTRNPDSILAKIYGLFTFKGDEIQRTYHLILMKNILGCNNDQIIRTYDMKGSRHDRQVNVGDTFANQLQKITLKDIDFMKEEKKIHIDNKTKEELRQIIRKDSLFLRNLNLIDYSLLVVRVKWNNPAQDQHFWGEYMRIPSNVNQNQYYHIGIIDYLQRWDLQKKGQQWWKKIIGKKDISAQQPKKYQKRYMSFINQITEIDQSTKNNNQTTSNPNSSGFYRNSKVGKKPSFIERIRKAQSIDRVDLKNKVKVIQFDESHEFKSTLDERKGRVEVELSAPQNISASIQQQKQSNTEQLNRSKILLFKEPFKNSSIITFNNQTNL